jgi:hypothetical protein
VSELFHCLARGGEFTGELRGDMVVCFQGDYSNDLYAISVAGHERTIQCCVAGLSKGAAGIEFFWNDFQPLRRKGAAAGSGCSLRPVAGGYQCHRQHLGYDTWHLLAWSKQSKFLLDGSDEALWRVLRGREFTTPLLRHWMPELRLALKDAGLLKDCLSLGTGTPDGNPNTSQLLMAMDLGLDKLVSQGIATGKLTFHQPELAAAVA